MSKTSPGTKSKPSGKRPTTWSGLSTNSLGRPEPDELAQEIAADLQAVLEMFASIAAELKSD